MSVPFDYNAWVALFPEFANVNSAQAGLYNQLAGLYFDTQGWPSGLTQAPSLMNLLTAHIAWLYAPRDALGNPSSTGTVSAPALVGRISSATQGSISVQSEYDANSSPSEKWYSQSKYGAALWAALAQFRTGFYVPGPQRARRAAAATYIFPSRAGWWR